ncbi:MAG: S1 RNA-binding domain-containing protein [Bacteroidales bacterium]
MVKITETCPDTTFDWSLYEDGWKGGNHLLANKKIKSVSGAIVYSREPYAYDANVMRKYTNTETLYGKDLTKGELVKVGNVRHIVDNYISVNVNGMDVVVDLEKERKLIAKLGVNSIKDFILLLSYNIGEVCGCELYAKVLESGDNPRISLWEGTVAIKRLQLIAEAKSNTPEVHEAIIEDANKGGYFVSIDGVKAFLPGSLAAVNKISNFKDMVGKTVTVMVEDYLADIESIIVSHKKYINHILPSRLKTLEVGKEYTGTVTGTTKFGVFIEFEDIFTGLLHSSKIQHEKRHNFASVMGVGTEVKFYIEEIKDNRIILSEYNPAEVLDLVTGYAEQIRNKDIVVTVSSIKQVKTSGVIKSEVQVKIDGFVGYLTEDSLLVLKKESNIKLIVGDSIRVVLDRLHDGKLYFEIPSLHCYK